MVSDVNRIKDELEYLGEKSAAANENEGMTVIPCRRADFRKFCIEIVSVLTVYQDNETEYLRKLDYLLTKCMKGGM